ncbi:MAG: hypothetical protein V2J89_05965, partial [Halieaceae bacterium]|nr:hypothetical protein [Halieaceae bacterium]
MHATAESETAADPGLDLAMESLPGHALHALLERYRSRHPVSPVRYAGEPAFLFTGHAEVAAAFRDNDRFPPAEAYRRTIEPVQGVTFQTLEDEQHRLYRRLATPAFRSKTVEKMEVEGLAALAHELIDALPPGGTDLARDFTHRYPFMVISRMLGIPLDREEAFRGWAAGFLAFTRDAEHAHWCSRQITEYLLPILADRRRAP